MTNFGQVLNGYESFNKKSYHKRNNKYYISLNISYMELTLSQIVLYALF